jgi:hypothetical protein
MQRPQNTPNKFLPAQMQVHTPTDRVDAKNEIIQKQTKQY